MQFDRAFYRSAEWKAARAARLALDNNKCTECPATTQLNVHHRTSPVNGGSKTAMYNLQSLCINCHNRKHSHMYKAKGVKKTSFKITRL